MSSLSLRASIVILFRTFQDVSCLQSVCPAGRTCQVFLSDHAPLSILIEEYPKREDEVNDILVFAKWEKLVMLQKRSPCEVWCLQTLSNKSTHYHVKSIYKTWRFLCYFDTNMVKWIKPMEAEELKLFSDHTVSQMAITGNVSGECGAFFRLLGFPFQLGCNFLQRIRQ